MGRQLTFGVLTCACKGCKKDKKKADALEKEIMGVLKKFDGVHLREFDFGQGKLVVEVADNSSDSNLLIKALQKIKKAHSVDLMKDVRASEKSQPQQQQLNKNMEAAGGKPKKAVTFILPEEEEEEEEEESDADDDNEDDDDDDDDLGLHDDDDEVDDLHLHDDETPKGPMGSYPVGPAAQGMMGYGYGYGNYYNQNQGQYMNMMPPMRMDEGRANWNDNDMNNNMPMPSQQEQAMDPYTYFSEENTNGCAIM
ncbi:hypothetical protein Pyn_15318 [Prunus yedoensis var. nudiflora]|uniref:HMA domain-containing protein n=1 Tax=Prunus yedoensis var. nudiflora TaxID=2094558 RepID=A0A314XVR2_PRUYE|nr:hypothetical protein Pyn_15318 [Prunus yedoensis var. nudiflora]